MNVAAASLVVTADDRTGAIEAAAACADAGWRVQVVPFGRGGVPASTAECVVVDLRSRHIAPEEAQRRLTMAVLHSTINAHRVHKIDSTLRGNWAEELTAIVDTGRRVVLIPAHPLAGRIAVGGVVLVDGVPLAETATANDPRLPVHSSRPADRLPGTEMAGAPALAAWLRGGGKVAIVDAQTMEDVDDLVGLALTPRDVVIAGSASVVGAVARACALPPAASRLPDPLLLDPVVALCTSMHPTSREQMAALAAAGVEVVMAPDAKGDPEDVAADVAERAHLRVDAIEARSVIIVGGDSAEAFLGDSVVEVFGSIENAVGIGEGVVRGRPLRLATKPGAIGSPNTLVNLVKRGTPR
jgi:uncharacterized protein YgbK (DUF1537 family)